MHEQTIENLKRWLYRKEGQVSTATRREATIGELMTVVEILIEKHD